MKRIRIGNITIYLEDCFYENVNSKIYEFNNNWILYYVNSYTIHIKELEVKKLGISNGMIRTSFHHLNQSQQWRDDKAKLTITASYICYETKEEAYYYCNQLSYIYGLLRSKISDIIRQSLLADSICGLHAGCISKRKDFYIIVGNKGNGKTSCIVNAYLQHWDIYSDETVFIKENQELDFLYRLPSLSSSVLHHYFMDSDLKLGEPFVSQLTNDIKILINLKLRDAADLPNRIHLHDVKKIFLLVNPDSASDYCSDQIKQRIISNNWIDGEKNRDFETIVDLLKEKSEITNIEKLKSFLRSDCYDYKK